MPYPLRPITPDEFAKFAYADSLAFGRPIEDGEIARFAKTAELDRMLVAVDGDDFVATGGVLSFDMTVPGGSLPAAAVTWISVRPTHTRQGILTSLMTRQFKDIRERGEPFAVLWATESVIYGRFGYGMASETATLTLDRAFKRIDHAPQVPGRCRFVTREHALEAWPAVYERIRVKTPGMFHRPQLHWQTRNLRERDKSTTHGRYYVQYEEGGQPLGFVRYEIEGLTLNGAPDGILTVKELQAETPAAYAALWGFVLGVDLIKTVIAEHRRVDEPLVHMLAEPRRMSRPQGDALWVRIVDVEAALAGRRYSSEGRVVIDVRDSFCERVAGRYALEGGPDGATCKPTTEAAAITMSASDLGAVYLGGTRLRTLAAAGRVQGSREAINRAATMFAWDPLPWCPEIF
jgi:predicted acetyltransferase